jgi:hypothetical protein
MVVLLVGVAAVVAWAFSGRGEAAETQSVPATRACGRLQTPPVPLLSATRVGARIRVEYELLARPKVCDPDAIVVTVSSVDKPDNVGPSASNGLVRLDGAKGVVQLKLPPLDLPPYEAQASTLTSGGARSETTSVRVPERGSYCRQTESAATCIERAQAKYERCARGEAPRATCPDYVWRSRPSIPYEPLRGVTRDTLEESFAHLAGATEHGGARFESVECSSVRDCVVTWRGVDGVFRARFEVSGHRQRAGCWIAERREILAGTARLRHLLADRQSACVHWKWNS